ncbi:hypothetical protein [Streptomyces sp. NPDC020681]|uniref:hypothetical protein n=1 Tax=Streptomyces sp. NPDC020681 TaxID=3365083 RepID=UPI0037A80374
MRGVRPRWIALAAVIAVLAAAVVLVRSAVGEDELAGNRAQLKKACQGLLPQEELRPFLPDDSAGALVEYGTVLDPTQESRALLDCRLSRPGAEVQIHAEAAVLGPDPAEQDQSAFPLALPPGAQGGLDVDEDDVVARLFVVCPQGLTRRTAQTKDLQVTVSLPKRPSQKDLRPAARTAVSVADWINERQQCGGEPLAPIAARAPERADAALCDWLDPKALGYEGRWKAVRNSPYRVRQGSCAVRRTEAAGGPKRLAITSLETDSASGAWARRLSEGFFGLPAEKNGRTAWLGDPDGRLELRAEATCDGELSYHQVRLQSGVTADANGRVVLTSSERRQLREQARAVLDRYLAAADGWPRRSHCRGAKIVEGSL